MGNFETSFKITFRSEWGYNPGGKEAETAFGIDRSRNPRWSGWATVDGYKPCSVAEMNAKLEANTEFMQSVHDFFGGYWSPLLLSRVNDQRICDNLFDCSINQGTGIAARFMQEASGAEVDGIIGNETLQVVNGGNAVAIYDKINALRKSRYLNTSGFSYWGEDWLRRLTDYTTGKPTIVK